MATVHVGCTIVPIAGAVWTGKAVIVTAAELEEVQSPLETVKV